MNLARYTQKTQAAVFAAEGLAQERQHRLLEPIHILLALIQQPDGIVREIVTTVSGGTQALRDELSADLDQRPRVHGPNLEFGMSSQTAALLASAERYARSMHDGHVSPEHLLLGLVDSGEKKRLADYGLTRPAILAALDRARGVQRVSLQTP